MVGIVGQFAEAGSASHKVLASAEYFLHSLDVKAASFVFIPTSRARLSQLSFIDGRDDVGLGRESVEVSIGEVFAWHSQHLDRGYENPEPHRFVFHTSFCGSTLMSRVFDIDGKCLTYREPQILLQLAEIKAKNHELYCDKQQWRVLVSFILDQFKLAWSDGQVNVIKPSNWGNSIIAELASNGESAKVVLLSMSEKNFLQAAFRGGGERLQYLYSALTHLLTAFPEFTALVETVKQQELDTAEQFSRFALISLKIQQKAFIRLARLLPNQDIYHCDYERLCEHPQKSFRSASDVLGLRLTTKELNESIDRKMSKHSKINDRRYSKSESRLVDQQVWETYQTSFERSLSWAKTELNLAEYF